MKPSIWLLAYILCSHVTLQGNTVETTSEHTEVEEVRTINKSHVNRFLAFDHRYIIPLLTRPMTAHEVREGKYDSTVYWRRILVALTFLLSHHYWRQF